MINRRFDGDWSASRVSPKPGQLARGNAPHENHRPERAQISWQNRQLHQVSDDPDLGDINACSRTADPDSTHHALPVAVQRVVLASAPNQRSSTQESLNEKRVVLRAAVALTWGGYPLRTVKQLRPLPRRRWRSTAEASPQITPKISLKIACSRTMRSKAAMSGRSHSSRIVGMQSYQ